LPSKIIETVKYTQQNATQKRKTIQRQPLPSLNRSSGPLTEHSDTDGGDEYSVELASICSTLIVDEY